MKAVWNTIVGLIFDDWWLGIGLLASILISYVGIKAGLDPQLTGWLLLLLMVGTLVLSLIMEYRKKTKPKPSN